MEHDHTAFGNVEEPLWLCEEPSIAHEHRTLQMVEDPVGSTVSTHHMEEFMIWNLGPTRPERKTFSP